MINFYNETDFNLQNQESIREWVSKIIVSESHEEGEIDYIFCNDSYLHNLNLSFLNHDTLTDIITFDNSLGKQVFAEIYISIERVKENAETYKVEFETELHRVIIHGLLHCCGYKDKTEAEQKIMTKKENASLELIDIQ